MNMLKYIPVFILILEYTSMANYSYKYPLLNDKDWLHNQYVVQGKSTNEIARLAGAKSANSARQALMRNGIRVLSISEGVRKFGSDHFVFDLQVIEGSLLGDACLQKWNKESRGSIPSFRKKNKYYDHLKYVAEKLLPESWEDHINETSDRCRNKKFSYFLFRTGVRDQLSPVYERWYPSWNNRVKVVPKDLVLTPEHLLHWFMDDGCSQRRKRPSRQIVITMCCESFTKDDQQFLVDQLDSLSISSCVTTCNSGTGYRIKIRQSSADAFYNIIGPCPVPSMEYKWK